jgi:hypothetical protein
MDLQNTSKLRKRLMDKELDPPALLTMTPDELKVCLLFQIFCILVARRSFFNIFDTLTKYLSFLVIYYTKSTIQ